ncbi:MAG: hypothetical protein AAGF66_03525 [Cyanobacteria bacterium P01_H01_bin.119]
MSAFLSYLLWAVLLTFCAAARVEAQPKPDAPPPTPDERRNNREAYIRQQPERFWDELRALINDSYTGFDRPNSPVFPPLDVEPDEALVDQGLVITDQTASATSFTLPSLWWVQQSLIARFDGNREQAPDDDAASPRGRSNTASEDAAAPLPPVIETWLAYRDADQTPIRVDLVLNNRVWNQLSYIERYALVEEFGLSTQAYGYNLRVFAGENPVSIYVCDFEVSRTTAVRQAANIEVDPDADSEVPCLLLLPARGRGQFSGRGPLD